MKVAVSSTTENLNAQLDPRFGRCAYFLVVNPDDMSFEAFHNESALQGGGAGIQAAQFLASRGVKAVITGNCGPNAVQTLSAAGVELFVGQTGTVKEVIERFKEGKLRPTSEATVDSHFGMALGADSYPGGGMGRGRGMGRIMGGGGFSGRSTPKKKGSGSVSKDLDLETLKKKADDLNQQLESIITRINQLETRD